MNKKVKKGLYGIFIRYLLLVLVAVPQLYIFYFIFRPLTVYPVYLLFTLSHNAFLSGNVLILDGVFRLVIIDACVAGSAYYLLLILNLSTPNIELIQRLKILGVSFISFLVINILRIFFIGELFINDSSFIDFAHIFFWYVGSTIFIVIIWFLCVRYFKIKKIPFVSDIKFFLNNIK